MYHNGFKRIRFSALVVQILPVFFVCNTSADYRRNKAVEFCNSLLLSHPEDTNHFLKSSTIQQVRHAPGVFQFTDGQESSAHEIQTLLKFLQVSDGQAIAISNFANLTGVPVVDAVYYPGDNLKPVNLSLKMGVANKGKWDWKEYVRKQIVAIRRSVDDYYSATHLVSMFGLTLQEGKIVAPSGRRKRRISNEVIARALLKVLGFNLENTKPRPVYGVIDMTTSIPFQAVLIRGKTIGAKDYDIHPEDVFLAMVEAGERQKDRRVRGKLNVSNLMRSIKEDSTVQGFTILFPQSVLKVDRFHFSLKPVVYVDVYK